MAMNVALVRRNDEDGSRPVRNRACNVSRTFIINTMKSKDVSEPLARTLKR
jgi:hypothetical protein